METTSHSRSSSGASSAQKLSYKFQRLRERIRQAIQSGELTGKLPGERQLARRFRSNAKTISKALTDLAAEGLIERSIGRGSFVKGSEGATPAVDERWLILCNPSQLSLPVVRTLLATNPLAQTSIDFTNLRPSFLSQFKVVIDLSHDTPPDLLRDLVVRNMIVVRVGLEPSTYSTHAVLMDRQLGVTCLARDLLLAGHVRLFAVDLGRKHLTAHLRTAVERFASTATVESGGVGDVIAAIEDGATVLVCDSADSGKAVRELLQRRGYAVPGQVSLAATGVIEGPPPCSGYFVSAKQKAETIIHLLRDAQARRPVTLWLTGAFMDEGTVAPVAAGPPVLRAAFDAMPA